MKLLLWLWASPWTLWGASLGALTLLTGGGAQRQGWVWEFHGGLAAFLLRRWPMGPYIAITFGHTVLGRDRDALDRARAHEFVHVRQYEKWGPLFGPLYLYFCAALWLRGKNPYYDNPFEVEAYQQAPIAARQPPPGEANPPTA